MNLEIITFNSASFKDFYNLNVEWLKKYYISNVNKLKINYLKL